MRLSFFNRNSLQNIDIDTNDILAIDETRDKDRCVLIMRNSEDIPVSGLYDSLAMRIFGSEQDRGESLITWHTIGASDWTGRRSFNG